MISVDPDFHHRGLGRALTVAGLDHLAAAGAAGGHALRRRRQHRGPRPLPIARASPSHHVDRAYLLEVAPA